MKATLFAIFLTVSMLVSSVAQSSEKLSEHVEAESSGLEGVGVPVIQRRDFGQVCPPIFDSTREVAQRYLDGGLVRVVQPEELVLAFDLPILTVEDLKPLTDKDDIEVCRELNDHFGHLFHEAVNVPGDSGIEPKHYYEITYYQASSQGMYIAILSAPTVVWEHESTETWGYARPPGPGTTVRFFDMNVQPILSEDVRDLGGSLRDE
jgi:hypothetical protein